MHYQRWKHNGDPLITKRRFRKAEECAEPDCGKPTYNRDLCLGHYRAWQESEHGPCSADGCELPWKSNGLCSTHYSRWRRHGSTDAPPKTGRQCRIDGCNERVAAKELCQKHYRNLRKHGAPELPPKLKRTWGPCVVAGCPNTAVRLNGMCDPHYRTAITGQKPVCAVTDCGSPARHNGGFCEPHGGWSSLIFRRYGITEDQYNALLAAQGGVCAICGRGPGTETRMKRLVVDHDHACCPGGKSCGKCVRGLLCPWCNRFIGLALDSPARLKDAIRYLERSKKKTRPLTVVRDQDALPGIA